MKGIDVSKWNGKVDWVRVRNDGIQFAMIKACSGSNRGAYSTDPTFDYNIRGAAAAGIPCGVYLYSYAKSVDAAVGEANYLVGVLTAYRKFITLPVVYDIEDNSQVGLGRATLTAMTKAFCDVIRSAGYKPMFYTSKSWLVSYIDASKVDADVWLAQWTSKPTWSGTYTMWQYTDNGTVAGISGAVDMNICYKDYAASQPAEQPAASPAPSAEETPKETVTTPAQAAQPAGTAQPAAQNAQAASPYDYEAAIATLSSLGRMDSPDLWREICTGSRAASTVHIQAMLTKWAADAAKVKAARDALGD